MNQSTQNVYHGILYETLANNQTDFSLVRLTDKHDSSIAHPNDKNIYINEINNISILCEPAEYELIQNKTMYDLNLEFDKWNRRNIYSSNQLPQQIVDYIENRYKFKQNDPRFNTLIEIFNKLVFKYPRFLTNSEELRDNIPVMVASYQNEYLYEYVSKGTQIKFNTPVANKLNYKLVNISRELEHKINNINVYFNELKDVLIFDQRTGYYYIKIDSENIPVICRHIYLTLSGISAQDISIECYKDGKCKYCGEEISIYNEDAKSAVSSRVYSMIYTFFDCIKDDINETMFWNSIINTIHEEILINNLKVNETELLAFCGIYLLKLQKETEDFIQYYKTRVMSFRTIVRNLNADLGRSSYQIDSILNQQGVFKTINKLSRVLKDNIFYTSVINVDTLPFAVLFDDAKFFVNSPIPSSEKLTPLQTLYINGKMYEFNDKFNDMRDKYWSSSPHYLTSKEEANVLIRDFRKKEDNVKNDVEFFKATCKIYCPAHFCHEFNKNVCKYCGIKSDWSNYNEVFSKYRDVILNTYVKEMKTEDKEWKVKSIYELDGLNEYDEKMLFIKYIPSEQISFNNIIMKNMQEANAEIIEKARSYLASIFRKNLEEIPKDNKTIIKLFCKAGAQHLAPTAALLENLQYIYANIKNIVQLIPSIRMTKKGIVGTDSEGNDEGLDEVVILDVDYTTVDIS